MADIIGVLTSGGDTPGLNAALRAVGKTAIGDYGMRVMGFRDGFRGLMENRTMRLDETTLSGILTVGGTILGTSRDKPHRMPVGGDTLDMTDLIIDNYRRHHLDVLVCLGGGGTQKNAYRLMQHDLNIITLPKTIDNDVVMTDVTFGFDTALSIATEAVDRLHSTAHSHHRIVVVEVMGHNTGWLALGAGIAGGADVMLLPEIPYDVEIVTRAVKKRSRAGKNFSIVVVSEGAVSTDGARLLQQARADIDNAETKSKRKNAKAALRQLEAEHVGNTLRLTRGLEERTGLESRLTILGHLQRGGTPSTYDRLISLRFGAAAIRAISENDFNKLIVMQKNCITRIPIADVANKMKLVPVDGDTVQTARDIGICLGD